MGDEGLDCVSATDDLSVTYDEGADSETESGAESSVSSTCISEADRQLQWLSCIWCTLPHEVRDSIVTRAYSCGS